MANLKVCTKCKSEQQVDKFHKHPRGKYGVRSVCKSCTQNHSKILRERYKKEDSEVYKTILINARKKAKKRRLLKPDYQKSYILQKKYDLSLDAFNLMRQEQDYKCKICLKHEKEERDGTLRVDHCHKTGVIRGLLCDRCNRGLGYFMEDTTILQQALSYVEVSRNG